MAKKTITQAVKDYDIKGLLPVVSRPGHAGKRSTVKASGSYPITNREDGASIFSRAVFSIARKGKETKVDGNRFVEAMESLASDAKKLSTVALPKGWNNLKNYLPRIRQSVQNGIILTFSVEELGEDADNALASAWK